MENDEKKHLSDLTYEEAIAELKKCHEMFRRCSILLDGKPVAEGVCIGPMSLFGCDELGDSDDLELYYKCRQIYEKSIQV